MQEFFCLLHEPLRELRAGGIIEVGEAVPVLLSHMDAGVISSGGGLGGGAVCAVILTVIVVELVGTDAAARGQKMSGGLFHFDVSEAHQFPGVEAFTGQDSHHGIGMPFSVRQCRMQV